MNRNQKGFSAVEGLLILVIVVLMGFVGWYLWSRDSGTGSKTTADPYASWKTYCDSSANVCVRYPSDWKPHDTSPIGPIAGSFLSPKGTLELDTGTIDKSANDGSNNPLTDPAQFYTASLKSLNTPQKTLKVWGGYNLGNPFNVPAYRLVDTSFTGQGGLEIGAIKSTTDPHYPSFTLPLNGKSYTLLVYDRNQGEGISQAQAKQWLSSVDGQLALQIVQSVYFK